MPNLERKRIDRIDQHLEGIVQTLELVSQMQLKTEAELDKLSKFVRLIGADHNKRITKLEKGKK
jgi:hypothetical protein